MRLVPDRPLPPYSYVPGQRPHPISDPAGHSFGQLAEDVVPLNPDAWLSSGDYCWAIDLFNQGYYWEAHEAWEQLWIAAGRSGTLADFLKALIKLAAAGVKFREGNPRGVVRHAARASELLGLTRQRLGAEATTYAGLQLESLRTFAARLVGDEQAGLATPDVSRMLDPLPVMRSTDTQTAS